MCSFSHRQPKTSNVISSLQYCPFSALRSSHPGSQVEIQVVAVGIMIAHNPSTDPDEWNDRIRLLPQVTTPMRRKG
jgi:hypothetical protein